MPLGLTASESVDPRNYGILSELKHDANMESKIQPILCCVGAAVAGRPTQFLMERAFDAALCDWRVITVEVQPDNFQAALDGMQAMAFTALRFFPELQPLAASRMLEPPHSALNVVTSAMRQDTKGEARGASSRWDHWDNQGFGLLDLIAGLAAASHTLLWLYGRSRMTQSLYNAMQASKFVPGQLLWSEAGDALDASEAFPLAVRPLTEVPQILKDALARPNPISHFVVVGAALAEQLPMIHDLEVAGEIQLLIATDHLLTRQQVNQAWPCGKATIFTENDQMIAAEAYDFRRWTGKQADLDLLRDAYDEYADF